MNYVRVGSITRQCNRWWTAVLAAVALLPLIFQGCSTGRRPAPLVLVGADLSGSETWERRQEYLRLLDALAEEGVPPGSQFRIWGFGPDAEVPEQLLDRRGTDPEDFSEAKRWIARRPVTRRGTYVLPLLAAMRAAAEAEAHSHRPVLLVTLSDGGWNDMAGAQREADRIAKLPNVRAVWCAPVDPENGILTRVNAVFAAFGERRLANGPFDTDDGLRKIHERFRR